MASHLDTYRQLQSALTPLYAREDFFYGRCTVPDVLSQYSTLSGAAPPQNLVVADEDLAQALRLLPNLPPGCDMAILPRSGTSLRHLTEHLRDSAPLQTLILILDGGPGYIRLGGQIIDRQAIGESQTELTEWQQLLTADARLFLLVNRLPQSGVGHEFSRDLSLCLQRPVLPRPLPDARTVLLSLCQEKAAPAA